MNQYGQSSVDMTQRQEEYITNLIDDLMSWRDQCIVAGSDFFSRCGHT